MVPDVPPDRPVTPRDAATVVLLRDSPRGPEVFLLRRVGAMAFAAGMTVFPGGGVDPRDADVSLAWSGPPPVKWAKWFDCSPELARALVCAAIRETFEESGVLLAGSTQRDGQDAGVVADTAPFAAARQALVDRRLSLAEFITEARLTVRADLLRPWASWVTPVGEPRRYDARFFLAELPAGQHADGHTTEADHAAWVRPADALTAWQAGRTALLPPTWITLTDLAEFGSVAEAMAAPRSVDKIEPKLVREDDAVRVVLPGDPGWEQR
ncbi:MAG TPA: NUDIX hydrolase [Pseudonocardiaceae bacterium]|nr:NUDIX hydrolase [Pseudonocardiaceae bacterium]